MNRQLYMGGGIMNAVPREQYGLGSVFKGVKNVVKKAAGAVKDIASSDVGKAALLVGGGMYAGGLGPFAAGARYGDIAGAGFASGLIPSSFNLSEMFTKKKIGDFLTSGAGIATVGGGLASLFAGMSAADQADIDEADIDERSDVVAEKLRQSLTRLGYTGQVLEDKVAQGVSEYTGYTSKAEGGRIGFDNGSPRGFDVGNFRELMIQDMIKKSPDGIVMDGERDTSILDSLREEDGDKGLDPSFPPVEYDDGTIYYPKTDEYYKIDGTQVDGISPGAKPVPKVLEAAQGGRIGFKKGGGMDRRGFLKLMGGLAALPIVGKFFKGAKVASKVVPLKGTTTAMPAWFPKFVDKVMDRGVGTKIDADIMKYEVKELPGIQVTKHDDGRIYVEGQNDYSRSYDIEYQPPGYEVVDYKSGKAVKTKGDFTASEEVPVNMDPDGNIDFEGEILEEVGDILTSDGRVMEEFATGTKLKTSTRGESRVGQAEVAAENAADDAAERAAMEADEFASGGLAKLLGE